MMAAQYNFLAQVAFVACAFLGILGEKAFAMKTPMNYEIRTYMSFGLPIDPANIRTLVDLDLSYALASTLVDWNESKEPIAGLAESWTYTSEKEVAFRLRADSKWSDGTKLTAQNVISSFERAEHVHRESLKSLFDLVQKIEVKDDLTIVFKLNVAGENSGLIRKLTEPMYGVLALKKDGSVDFSKSSGPYSLKASSDKELSLGQNSLWYKKVPAMAELVTIRPPPKGEELQKSFLNDDWINLLTSSSLTPENTHKKFVEAHYTIWSRSLDKIFHLSPSSRLANNEGRQLVRTLNSKMNRKTLTDGIIGFNLADQFFPSGYVLFNPEFQKSLGSSDVPQKYKSKPLEILGIDTRVSESLRKNLAEAIKNVTGAEPVFKIVPLSEFEAARVAGNYDLVAASLPVNDPNIEGAIGFFFGLTPPIIPDAAEAGAKAFSKRVQNAKLLKNQPERNLEYRKIFSEATNEGSILPLFHFSTVVVAKKGIDLSHVPTTDETVAFSKIRFK